MMSPSPSDGGAAALPAPAGGPPPPPIMLHDVTVVRRKKKGQCRIWEVPPEEFGVSRRARSIRIQDAPYLFHAPTKSEHDLIEMGFDPDQVANLPYDDEPAQGSEAQSRDTVSETSGINSLGFNPATRMHRIVEHYCWLDYEETGKAKRYRITTGGGARGTAEILRRIVKDKEGNPTSKTELAIDEVAYWGFAAMTPVIVTHRFFGRSLADLVMDIQRIKTALLRGVLDNTYLLNNQRIEISESHSVDQTLDDLLNNRPGGIVRTKMPGGLNPIVNQPIGDAVMAMMGYMDQVREWRTGVSHQQQGLDSRSLQNVGQDLGLQMMTAAQQKLKLIARIFAETGVRDLFLLIHAICRQNATAEDTVKLRGKWVTVNPRDWKERRDMTVTVGLGNGDKPQQLAFMQQVLNYQIQAVQAPQLGLIKPGNLYNSLKRFLELGGEKAPDKYFIDPDATNQDGTPVNPTPQAPPDPKTLEVQGNLQIAQLNAQTAQAKAQAEIQTSQQKAAADIAATQQRLAMEQQAASQEAQLKQRDRDMQEMKLQHEAAIEERQMRLKEAAHNQSLVTAGVAPGAPPLIDSAVQAMANLAAQHTETMKHMASIAGHLSAPKRVLRGPDGKVIGVEAVIPHP